MDTPSSQDSTLPPDELYDALANDRRRATLLFLEETEGWVGVKDVAREIAPLTAKNAKEAEESVYISLIQVHLPKLDTFDIIEYDDEEKMIRPGRTYDHVIQCLHFHENPTTDESDSPHQLLVALTGIGLLAALLVPSFRYVLILLLVVLQIGILISSREEAQTLVAAISSSTREH